MVLVTALALTPLLGVGLGGCAARGFAGDGPAPRTASPSAATTTAPAGSDHAKIYAEVIRHYLAGPDTSFPERFALAYVMDRADSTLTETMRGSGGPARTEPITAADQAYITNHVKGVSRLEFVDDRDDVVVTNDDKCGVVKNDAILVSVAPPEGAAPKVTVAINGYVACLGATWLTYVVERQPTGEWRVTGTTGPMAIA
jgi:hypothetical protein